MNLKLKQWADGLASPVIRDRWLLTSEGRTAADDWAEFGAGTSGEGQSAVGTIPEDGTLQGDVKGVDWSEGYHDEPPPDPTLEQDDPDSGQPQHDWKKRYSDTKDSRDQLNHEVASLKAQLEAMLAERMQAQQPHILQPGQTDDPIKALDQQYEQQKQQLTTWTMNQIKGVNRQDPRAQDKVAELWATHQAKLVELDGNRREQKAQLKYQQQTQHDQYVKGEIARALSQAGYDAAQYEKEYRRMVRDLNEDMPGWDQGMAPAQTWGYVVEHMKKEGRLPVNPQHESSPYDQHQALRKSGMGALKAGTRMDPAKPAKPKLPEEKDISFNDQIRKYKRSLRVTPEMAARMRAR